LRNVSYAGKARTTLMWVTSQPHKRTKNRRCAPALCSERVVWSSLLFPELEPVMNGVCAPSVGMRQDEYIDKVETESTCSSNPTAVMVKELFMQTSQLNTQMIADVSAFLHLPPLSCSSNLLPNAAPGKCKLRSRCKLISVEMVLAYGRQAMQHAHSCHDTADPASHSFGDLRFISRHFYDGRLTAGVGTAP
jgi:hypothetical protein